MMKKNHLVDEFFEEYRTLIIRNAYMYVKDYYIAEDICQETFIRLSKNLNRVPAENVKGWLIRVSERLSLDYLRKGGKYKIEIGLEDKDLSHVDGIYIDPYEIVERKETCEEEGKVLRRLKKEKPLWYEVMLMSCVEEMDNGTISEKVGIKPYLVSKWKERARKWLNEKYEEEEKGR